MSRRVHGPGASRDVREERVQRGAGLGPAVEALPQQAHTADEFVADVDRYEVALEAAVGAAQQQRLHVGFEQFGEGLPPRTDVQVAGSSSLSVAPAGLG